jgi:hypothetical protein
MSASHSSVAGTRDMSRWPTAAHFVSWLGLCPDNDISAGRVLWRSRRKVKNPAGQLFRLAAYALHHDQTPMGDHLRRMKSKLGPAAATTATAHKIAIIFYTMVKNQVVYDATLWAQRDAERDKRIEGQAQAAGTAARIQAGPHRRETRRGKTWIKSGGEGVTQKQSARACRAKTREELGFGNRAY